jgi:NAD(P)-dependent dehydrogenase (short-subunit alcohol dehydrogenase family)
MDDLKGKIAIVTGAGSGIGRASTLLFARHGARVIASDVSDGVDETAKMGGSQVIAVRADAGNEADVIALVTAAQEHCGGLDVFFANAGIGGGIGSIFEQTVEEWQEVLRINLIGPFLAVKHGGKAIAEAGKGGSIICTASVAGIRSGAGGPAYSASKAGVINMVRVAAQQLATSNVRCNALCPGLTETGMTKFVYDKAREKGVTDRLGYLNPLRRGAQPEELAEAALFLASDRSSYVNGQALVVDGGLSSSHPVTRQEFGRTAV